MAATQQVETDRSNPRDTRDSKLNHADGKPDSVADLSDYRLAKPPNGATNLPGATAEPLAAESPQVKAMLSSFELSDSGSSKSSRGMGQVDHRQAFESRNYPDGSQYVRRNLPGGKVEHRGSGQTPAYDFHVIDSPDGSYKVLDKTGKPAARSMDPEVVKERARLDKVVQIGITDPEARAKFHADEAKLEQRFAKNPAEAARTFSEISSMLEHKQNAAIKPENVEKLAKAVVSQSATPDAVDQGNNPTCSVSSIESVVYHDNPSVAAKAMKDIAVAGEYQMSNGKTVKFDRESLEANGQASKSRWADGERSLATQYMNVLLTNSVLSERGTGDSFKSTASGDHHMREQPGKEPQVVGDAPDLSHEDMARSYRLLTGDQGKKVIMIEHESKAPKDEHGKLKDVDGVAVYKDQKEYEQLLADLKKKQALPVVNTIDIRTDFRPAKDPAALACRANEDGTPNHALVIDDYSKNGVTINNQWAGKCDYTLPTNKAFTASVDPDETMSKRVASGYESGKRDFAAEILQMSKLYRQMRKTPGADGSSESLSKNLQYEMTVAEKYLKEHGQNLFNAEAAGVFADTATMMLNRDDRAKLADVMRASPLFKNQKNAIDLVGETD